MKSAVKNLQLFVKHIQQQPLSVICYILWFLYHRNEKTDLIFSIDPLRYICRYENKYTLFGENIWEFTNKIRWFNTNIVLVFEKHYWDDIRIRFDNFRNVETNKPANIYNTYLTFNLSKNHLLNLEPIDDQIIQIPSYKHPLPKRYRPLDGGLGFGSFKGNKLVCFAAAPYIFIKSSFSFAILRGVETNVLERRQGYALKTVGVLCKELFLRYDISNIFLWVEDSNMAAKKLYRKLGFSEEAKVFTTYCDLK
ncbi:MAG: GNAT family N-acetyltransferase [Promethearchaeota archaeon]